MQAEYEEATATGHNLQALHAKSDSDLFVVDQVGNSRRKRKRAYPMATVPAPSATTFQRLRPGKKKPRRSAVYNKRSEDSQLCDIWDDVRASDSSSIPAEAKMPLPHPGVSYNPELQDHQDAVAIALSVEVRRNEAELEAVKPMAPSSPNVVIADQPAVSPSPSSPHCTCWCVLRCVSDE